MPLNLSSGDPLFTHGSITRWECHQKVFFCYFILLLFMSFFLFWNLRLWMLWFYHLVGYFLMLLIGLSRIKLYYLHTFSANQCFFLISVPKISSRHCMFRRLVYWKLVERNRWCLLSTTFGRIRKCSNSIWDNARWQFSISPHKSYQSSLIFSSCMNFLFKFIFDGKPSSLDTFFKS